MVTFRGTYWPAQSCCECWGGPDTLHTCPVLSRVCGCPVTGVTAWKKDRGHLGSPLRQVNNVPAKAAPPTPTPSHTDNKPGPERGLCPRTSEAAGEGRRLQVKGHIKAAVGSSSLKAPLPPFPRAQGFPENKSSARRPTCPNNWDADIWSFPSSCSPLARTQFP